MCFQFVNFWLLGVDAAGYQAITETPIEETTPVVNGVCLPCECDTKDPTITDPVTVTDKIDFENFLHNKVFQKR